MMTDNELDNNHIKFTIKYGQAITKSLKEDIPLDENMISDMKFDNLCEFVLEWLIRSFRYWALIIYLAMEKTKNFFPHGEHRTKIGFIRVINHIPNNREVNYYDLDSFNLTVSLCDKKYGEKTGEELVELLNGFSIELFGSKYPHTNLHLLKKLINLLNVDCFLFNTDSSPYGCRFLLGRMEKRFVDQAEFYMVITEYIRSPQLVLSLAAEVYGKSSIMRKTALEVITFNKSEKYFDQTKYELNRALRHPNSAIREGLKSCIFHFYGINNKKQFLDIKDIYLNEMVEMIFMHETGHILTYKQLDPVEYAFQNCFNESDDVLHTLSEMLADWAIEKDSKKGTISKIVELSKVDIKRATKEFYTLLSDNWFVDEEEEYLPLFSNCQVGLGSAFICADRSINFKKLEAENGEIYHLLLMIFKDIIHRLLDVIHNAHYNFGVSTLDYDDLEQQVFEMYENSPNAKSSIEELRKFTFYWKNIIGQLDYSQDGWEQFNKVFSEGAAFLEQTILDFASGGNAQKYGNSLRKFIVERAKETGIIKQLPQVDTALAVQKACKAIGMPDIKQKHVQEKIKKISEGYNYSAEIYYEGEKDSFIEILQEMMFESGYGEIESGMIIDNEYFSDMMLDEQKINIKDELENLLCQLEAEYYLEIDVLRINTKYSTMRQIVEELLPTMKFINGNKMAEKIKAIEYIDLNNDALMEVLIPIYPGYMDWNSIQAVWEINEDLRPDEFMLRWIIDKDFLEALSDAYLLQTDNKAGKN